MRFAPLALVFALGLATASAQPTVDGALTDAEYLLLDDNAGGPAPGFGTTNYLNAIYAHVDVASSTLYLGVAGLVENGNRIVVFLDTRDGGYATADYGAGGPGAVSNLNPDVTFDAGFLADFAVTIGTDGTQSDHYIDVVELKESRAMGASTSRFIGSATSSANIAATPVADDATYGTGFEIAIPFADETSPIGAALAVTHPAISVVAFLTADSGFASNLFLTPLPVGAANQGFEAFDLNTLTQSPVAYTWRRSSAVAGWRQVGNPFLSARLSDFAVQNHVQGVPGTTTVPNGAPNIFTYGGFTGGAAYNTFSSDTNPLDPTVGLFWYHYDTMVSDRWVALPFTLQAGGPEYLGFLARDEYTPAANGTASYLLSNPYASPFDTAFLTELTGYTLSNSLFVWDPDTGVGGDYVEIDRGAADVANRTADVMSGFWADLTDTSGGTAAAPTFRFDPAGRVRPAIGVTRAGADRRALAFELDLLDGDDALLADRTTRLVFAEDGLPGTDAHDAAEPPAISGQSVRLSFVDGDVLRAVLGRELDPEAAVVTRLSLASTALGEQTYRLRWDAASLPADWTLSLRDLATGVTADLRADADLVFDAADGPAEDRFELTVTPAGIVADEADPAAGSVVFAPRPNPTTGVSTVRVQVDRPQAVRVEAFDLLGRRVATAFDGSIETARSVAVDAAAFAPGVYVVRVSGETFAASHRLVVAR